MQLPPGPAYPSVYAESRALGIFSYLVLPNSDHNPTPIPKLPGHFSISLNIAVQLPTPERFVAFGFHAMSWAAVPETTVNKHSDAVTHKDHVWFSGQRAAKAVSKAKRPKRLPKPHFRSGVFRANARHTVAALLFGEYVAHFSSRNVEHGCTCFWNLA